MTTGDTTIPAAASQCVAPEAVVNPTGVTGFNPGAGPVPGNGQDPSTLPFRNFQISDTPSNWDYTFRAGLFGGDYNGNTTGPKNPTANELGGGQTAALWTDARNGRGSGDPTSTQPGRNPICEQSDVFFQAYSAVSGGGAAQGGSNNDSLFWSTPCPAAIQDKSQG